MVLLVDNIAKQGDCYTLVSGSVMQKAEALVYKFNFVRKMKVMIGFKETWDCGLYS